MATGQSNMLSCSGPVVVSCLLAEPWCCLLQPALKTSPVAASCQSLGLCFLSVVVLRSVAGYMAVFVFCFFFTHRAHVPCSVHTLVWALVCARARALSCVFPLWSRRHVLWICFRRCLCEFWPAGRWKWALMAQSDTFTRLHLCDHVYFMPY